MHAAYLHWYVLSLRRQLPIFRQDPPRQDPPCLSRLLNASIV